MYTSFCNFKRTKMILLLSMLKFLILTNRSIKVFLGIEHSKMITWFVKPKKKNYATRVFFVFSP